MIGWAEFPDKLDYLIQWALQSCRANHDVQPTLLRGAVYTMQGVKLVTDTCQS